MAKSKGIQKLREGKVVTMKKMPTGIPGFEEITFGGLPRGRTTLVSGSSGSGKTIFACQFLVEGIRQFGENGIFVTFEEQQKDLVTNVKSFGWQIEKLEAENKWKFVDASLPYSGEMQIVGDYNLKGLIARITAALNATKAKRIVLDSIGSIFRHFEDPGIIRREIYNLLNFLKKKNLMVIITSERLEEYGSVSRYGVEEYITDNVVLLRNVLDNEKRRRTIEVLKYRGSVHSTGEQSFIIDGSSGFIIIPLTRLELTQKSSSKRIFSGNDTLDDLCGGGFFKDSIILISGATGTGKTLMVTEFIKGGIENNEKVLFLAYEESKEQLTRNAMGWNVNFQKMEAAGTLRVEALYPETASLEEHLLHIQKLVNEFKPARFALDSISAIERGSNEKNFREFIIALTSFLKKKEITGILTSTNSNIVGGNSITDRHISTITDTIILLRYAEVYGSVHRVISVLKMRGSLHTKEIFEFDINENGMRISKNKFHMKSGILGGPSVTA